MARSVCVHRRCAHCRISTTKSIVEQGACTNGDIATGADVFIQGVGSYSCVTDTNWNSAAPSTHTDKNILDALNIQNNIPPNHKAVRVHWSIYIKFERGSLANTHQVRI